MDIASLGIKIDSSQAEKAAGDLDKLTAASQKAEGATDGVAAGQKKVAEATKQVGASANVSASHVGKLVSELARGKFDTAGASLGRMAVSNVALAGSLTAVGWGTLGVVAGLASLGVAAYKGAKEQQKLNDALLLTGNYAGLVTGQLDAMAASTAKAINGSVGNSREVLSSLVGTGRFTVESLSEVAAAAQLVQRFSGASSEQVTKDFASMSRGVADWAEKANEAYHFLDLATYKYIKQLEDQGNKQEAMRVASVALSQHLGGDLTQNLGYLAKAWDVITRAASAAWAAMKNAGKDDDIQDRISALQDKVAKAKAKVEGQPFDASPFGGNAEARAQLPALKAELAMLQEVQLAARRAASAQSDRAQVNEKAIAGEKKWGEIVGQNLTQQERMTKALKEARDAAKASGQSAEALAKVEAEITKRYTPKKPKGRVDNSAAMEARAQLASDVDAVRKAQDALADNFANAEKIMDAKRAAGLISEAEYYEAKRAFLTLNSGTQEESLKAEIALLEKQQLKGREKIDNDRKIFDAESKLAKLRASTAAKGILIDVEQQASMIKTAKAYAEARAAAQSYLDTMTLQQSRSLAGMGKGQQQRDRDAGLSQIGDKYSSQRLQLESDKRRGMTDEDYAKQLALINEFQGKATSSYEKYYDDLIAKQSDWQLGAHEALKNYADDAANTYKSVGDLVTGAFKGMENALVDFVTTGKGNFGDLVKTIIAGLIRIQIQADLAKIASSAGGAGGIIGAIAGMFGGAQKLKGGLDYVPYDEFPAMLHKGERVMTAGENARGGGNQTTINVAAGPTRNEVLSAIQMATQASEARMMNRLHDAKVI